MATIQEIRLSVPDISCEHCVHAINGALSELPGIEKVHTDIATKTVQFSYDSNRVSIERVEAVLDDIGYTVGK